jgi:hypothetical protein
MFFPGRKGCKRSGCDAPGSPAPVQRVVHRRKDLVDGDLAVLIGVAGVARRNRRVPQSDVHHRKDIIHGDRPVAVAIADARRPLLLNDTIF